MTSVSYQRLILEGIKDLPDEKLAEIAELVFFVRRRTLYPTIAETERWGAILSEEHQALNQESQTHLDENLQLTRSNSPFNIAVLTSASGIDDIPEIHGRLIAATSRGLAVPLITTTPSFSRRPT